MPRNKDIKKVLVIGSALASFTTGDMYDHHDADGFITLFGLPLKVRAMKLAEVESQKQTND